MAFQTTETASFWRFIASTLDRLVAIDREVDPEGLAWRPPASAPNSVDILIRHTLGNAEDNLLGVFCGQVTVRRRDDEFAASSMTSDDLAALWGELRPQLATCLESATREDLQRKRIHPRRGAISGMDVLIVVARHAAEHLGQAELTRDLWHATPR